MEQGRRKMRKNGEKTKKVKEENDKCKVEKT